MTTGDPTSPPPAAWTFERRPWGRGDLLALLAWTVAVAAFFWDAVSLSRAFFYFDVTEINYPYRWFLAEQYRTGQFARWMPGLYCGFPLYAESQAGYWHPLKPLLYPWMLAWKAFNLDTVGSVWLTGLATYGWLRRHVGPSGSLAGAALFGLSGFVWAHLIHTSMANALISVPLAFWALEVAWDGGRLRGLGLGALAMASQVFSGHLQDTILTGMAIGIYALYRAATERGWRARLMTLGFAAGLGGLGIAVAAVQWMPSKNLLDRSPRAGGLTWEQLTYGSWSPELLPTLIVREAYGTRARDTDWMDGYYPYHEMNAYMGLVGMALAALGARAARDRWVAFWVILLGLGSLAMLGRYTALFDLMHKVPVVGSSRIPVRYHLWVSLAVAALAAVGVDRLARVELGRVRLRGALGFVGVLILLSIPILAFVYYPAWADPRRWSGGPNLNRSRWLTRELVIASIRTVALALAGWSIALRAAREIRPAARARLAALLPVVIIADLLGSHRFEAPTIDPSYWTDPPASAKKILADPGTIRVYGVAQASSGEPGYASESINFPAVRDTLPWSLPPIWGLRSATGETPMYDRRLLTFHDHAAPGLVRFDVEGVTHLLMDRPIPGFTGPIEPAGTAFIHRNTTAQPRARVMGRPAYVADQEAAGKALGELGAAIRDRVIVEDPDRPIPIDAPGEGTARIMVDEPERVEVEVEARGPAYLVLADTFDPGWSATLDGRPAPIRPAFAAFRAVAVNAGPHRVVFTYEPAGFRLGLIATIAGLLGVLACLAWPGPVLASDPPHAPLGWPRPWPAAFALILIVVVAASTIRLGPDGLGIQPRWRGSFHGFTWGAGIEAIAPMRSSIGR
ncbi:YfhO family protein [Tundrisphaera sp. TA3]|uniref:YfhO family protein n=1 Tax=Tundrisphaera sp. TA3 TaxID=3435775 RepID=UPI003EC12584